MRGDSNGFGWCSLQRWLRAGGPHLSFRGAPS